ncbi:MAG: translation elongation factor Ts [Pseudomonadota bacterium]
MNITASMVKELRDKSGAGMMDCKKALAENDGNVEAALDWLRTKGIAKADKKAGRTAAEGLVGIAADGTKAAVVEVNSETDFVARNDGFQAIVGDIAKTALTAGTDAETLAAATISGGDATVDAAIKDAIGTIGENMALRRSALVEVSDGVVASYMHNAVTEGLGKIGVLVALESTGDKAVLAGIGRQIAMHIAAINPLSLSEDDMDPEILEREKAVLEEQAKESGKPAEIIEKMMVGRVRKFLQENVLLQQALVTDPDNTVEQALANAAKEAGAEIKLTRFERMQLGEGIEKEETDFAAEVAAAVQG